MFNTHFRVVKEIWTNLGKAVEIQSVSSSFYWLYNQMSTDDEFVTVVSVLVFSNCSLRNGIFNYNG